MSTARNLAAYGRRFVETKSATYSVLAADIGKTFLLTGTWTLALPLVAVAQNGFSLKVKNIGAGTITIDPAGSETIDGSGTIALAAGVSRDLICDGSGWYAL